MTSSVLELERGQRLWLSDRSQKGAADYLIGEIYRHHQYYKPGFEILPDDVVIDIGANVGVFSIMAAQLAHRGKVYAIEPTSAIDTLLLSLEKNDIRNIVPLKVAAGTDNETWDFVHYPGFNIINHRSDWKPALITRIAVRVCYSRYYTSPIHEKCRAMSLNSIIKQQKIERVDFLKIDCEGSEYEVLEEISKETFAKIQKCVIEFHEFTPKQRHQTLLKRLHENGFKTEVKKSFVEYRLMHFGKIWAWK